jgi:hypothetical protein
MMLASSTRPLGTPMRRFSPSSPPPGGLPAPWRGSVNRLRGGCGLWPAWLLLAGLLPAGTEAGAQEPTGVAGAAALEVQLLPSLGWYHPSDLLYRSDFPPARARMGRAVSVGLGVQLTYAVLPLALRVQMERADWFDTRMVGTIPGNGFQSTLSFHHTVPTAVTFLMGDVVLRPRREIRGIRPYAFLGVGVKRYAFGEMDPPDPLGFTRPMDGTGGMIHYGLGTEVGRWGWTLAPELGGSFSRYVLVDDDLGGRRSHPQREWMLAVKLHLPLVGGGR